MEKFRIHTRKDFWIEKIENNIRRDRLVNKTLRKQGWTVLRFWGKDIEKRTENCVTKILKAVGKKMN
ncbi:DUF559 domain-containing protein [Candidatus Avelusimicrobium faecicola]|uniref:DUF559 domain-containing protein n=1 Tax=Candidatus Avelusimicrobium faecicola TaxID=3416205 RepID=UPI002050CE67|nr:MAG TPA: DNA mismatch endonuclease [Caudoviricetes sp.]